MRCGNFPVKTTISRFWWVLKRKRVPSDGLRKRDSSRMKSVGQKGLVKKKKLSVLVEGVQALSIDLEKFVI